MLDCGLDINSALHFLPLPLVASKRLSNLPNWIPKDAQDAALLDGVCQYTCSLFSLPVITNFEIFKHRNLKSVKIECLWMAQ